MRPKTNRGPSQTPKPSSRIKRRQAQKQQFVVQTPPQRSACTDTSGKSERRPAARRSRPPRRRSCAASPFSGPSGSQCSVRKMPTSSTAAPLARSRPPRCILVLPVLDSARAAIPRPACTRPSAARITPAHHASQKPMPSPPGSARRTGSASASRVLTRVVNRCGRRAG